MFPHSSEVAQVFRETTAQRTVTVIRGQEVEHNVPWPPPGSIEEREALRAIDTRRYEEISPPSNRALRRRLRRHWSDRDHALGS